MLGRARRIRRCRFPTLVSWRACSTSPGAAEQAASYYEWIVRRCGGADPELRPIVRAAQARLDELN
jgi:hypothetical protein